MENIFMIHIDDYVKHIEDKLELYAMLRQIEHAVSKLPECRATEEVRERMAAFSPEIDKLWEEWNIPKRYLVSGELDDLSEVMGEELMEPEDVGYFYDAGDAPAEELLKLLSVIQRAMAQKEGDVYRCKITIHSRGQRRR